MLDFVNRPRVSGTAKAIFIDSFVLVLTLLVQLSDAPKGEAQAAEVSPPDAAAMPDANGAPSAGYPPAEPSAPPGASTGGEASVSPPTYPASPPPAQAPPADAGSEGTAPPQPKRSFMDHFEVGGLLGYALQLDSKPGHPWGVTLGARGGLEFENGLYLGLSLLVSVGRDSTFGSGAYTYSAGFWQSEFGVEGGYDLKLGALTLRPYAGVGVAHTFFSVTESDYISSVTYDDEASTDAYVTGGAALQVELGSSVYIGADARGALVFASNMRSALIVVATGGARFL